MGASAEPQRVGNQAHGAIGSPGTRQPYRIWAALPLEYAARGPTRASAGRKKEAAIKKESVSDAHSRLSRVVESVTALRNLQDVPARTRKETRRHNTTGGRRPRRDGGVRRHRTETGRPDRCRAPPTATSDSGSPAAWPQEG